MTTTNLPWHPFPVDSLPEPIRGFVRAGSTAIGCDPSFLALPLLAALAAAIGNSRRLRLKRSWSEPAILWTAIVGESGTHKSPALELALRPIRERQSRALAEHAQRFAEYQDALLRYERDLAVWKRSKGEKELPEQPLEPVADRCWCDDPTVEALAVMLQKQPRGLLLARDELAGWLTSFDRYSKGTGGDVARWLEMHGGREMVIDRKTGGAKMIYVPRAAVTICGGVQPAVLTRALTPQFFANGLAARLLLACPPRRPKRWTDADVARDTEAAVAAVIDRLYDLQPEDSESGPQPVVIDFTPEGKRSFVGFYNEHAKEQVELAGDLSAAWSKLEGYAARLALVIHLTRNAAGDCDHGAVDADSVQTAVRMVRWFAHEARRVYDLLGETDEDRERRRLIDWIAAQGGSATPRDLMRHSRQYATTADARKDLLALVQAGAGKWDRSSSGERGRPAERFVLAVDTVDVDRNSGNPEENPNCVNVNTVSTDDINDLFAQATAETEPVAVDENAIIPVENGNCVNVNTVEANRLLVEVADADSVPYPGILGTCSRCGADTTNPRHCGDCNRQFCPGCFREHDCVDVDRNRVSPEENVNCVNVGTVNTPSPDADDWDSLPDPIDRGYLGDPRAGSIQGLTQPGPSPRDKRKAG